MSSTANLNLGIRRLVPSILQTEASECSLTCLAMIAHFHGYKVDLPTLRRRFGMSSKGARLEDIVRVSEQIGFASRPLRLELEELSQLQLPCILHWDLNHFVVLTSVNSTQVMIHDPAVGKRRLSYEDVSRHFTGVALELLPTSRFESAAAPPRVRYTELLGKIAGLKTALTHIFGLAFAIEVFAMISPLFMGMVIDYSVGSADRNLLVTLVIGFSLLLFLQTAISTLRAWLLMGMGATLKVQSRANLFTHLLNLPTSFFEARHLGDIMSRFGSQEVILNAITKELVESVLDGIMATVTLVVMLVFAPDLAFVVAAGATAYAALRYFTYLPLRDAANEAVIWKARGDSHFLESLRGIRTVKLFNGQEQRRTLWLNLLVETVNRQLTTERIRLVARTSSTLLFGLLTIMVVWLGALHVIDTKLSVGLLFAFLSYKDQFLQRIRELVNKIVDMKMLRLHAERLADIALTEPEMRDAGDASIGGKLSPLRIELRNVNFRYSENEPWVLKNVSMTILAGESVAICGPSGCGKSTLLKLLSGLLLPTSGEILIDGIPIRQMGINNYRAKIGVVMQDDQLFAGSISENISFFAGHADKSLIEASAKLASVHQDIMTMPMGYGTLIGDMGTTLSGGQKQRVFLARAVYRLPGLLLLDEATSHLDLERENAVNAGLKQLPITRISIAHRIETIRAAGRVITLDSGEVRSVNAKYQPGNVLAVAKVG